MTRQGKRLPPALAWIPWWLSVIMAIASYVGLKYLAQPLAISTGLAPLAGFLPQIAPLAAIGFLLFATVLLYDGDEATTYPEEPENTEDPEDLEDMDDTEAPEEDQVDRQSGEKND